MSGGDKKVRCRVLRQVTDDVLLHSVHQRQEDDGVASSYWVMRNCPDGKPASMERIR